MPKEKIPFEHFIIAVGPHAPFVEDLHRMLLDAGCTWDIKEAKSGLVVSYVHKETKRTILNYVFRKKGPQIRLYADNVFSYMGLFESFPEEMRKTMLKASPCRRMLSPELCNPHCPMGYDYLLDGERQQKCRYGAFLFFLGEDSYPHLRTMVEQELLSRAG